jgi:co-chaperonin GroES (HSP10)
MNKIQAIGEYITVCPLKKQDEETKSGLLVPKSQSKLVMKGFIKSIGTGEKIKEMNFEIGDIVFFQDIQRDFWFDEDNSEGLYFIRHDMLFGKIKNK